MAAPQRILVTGATGFLGSHLARRLVADGASVIALKRPTSDLRHLADLRDRVVLHDWDGADPGAVFRDHPDITAVVHAATCYGRAGESVQAVFEANTRFPLQLLEAAAGHGVPLFVNTDTALPGHVNAYALSKRQFAAWGRHFAEGRALRFVNVRLQHIFGPGDEPPKFAAHVIRSCVANVPELPLTPGEQQRDFIYIDDAVAAYALLVAAAGGQDAWFQEYDLGMGKAIAIREFVEQVKRAAGATTRLRFGALPYRPNEAMTCQADLGAMRRLGWDWQTSLEAGIRKTIETERAACAS